MDTSCFVDGTDGFAENLWECPQALRARDHDVRLPGRVMSVALNPDGSQPAGKLDGRPLRVGHGLHDLQQKIKASCFFLESVSGNPRLDTVARERCGARISFGLHCWRLVLSQTLPTVSISCEIAAPPRAILARASYTAGRSPF